MKCSKCGKALAGEFYPDDGVSVYTDGYSKDFRFHLCYDCWEKVQHFVKDCDE